MLCSHLPFCLRMTCFKLFLMVIVLTVKEETKKAMVWKML